MDAATSPQILIPLLRDDPDFSGLAEPETWHEIQRAAVKRKVAPLVAFAVRGNASPAQRQWCDGILTRSWVLHDASIRDLDWVLDQLDQGGVQVIVLKGPLSGRRHFDPPFLRRPSGDIDLAVRDADLEKAAAVLTGCGYEATATLNEARRTSHHLVLESKDRPRVELHTRLSHGTRGIPVDEFFERVIAHTLPTGRTAAVLCPADELLQLLLHFASDRFSSFFHLYELRKVWREAPASVQTDVITRAVRHKFAATLWLTDMAFQVYWGERFLAPGHGVPRTWLQHRITPALLQAMEGNILRSRDRSMSLRLEGRWLDLHMTDSPQDAARGLGLILWVAWREFVRGRWGTIYRS